MSTSAKMKKLYTVIQQKLFDMIPEKWNKIFLYASVIDGKNRLETGEMYFYYIPKGILKREPVNVYEVPNKFNLDETQYFKLADDLYGIIKQLRKEYIAINGNIWSNIVISIEDFMFKVEYRFDNLATSPYSNYDRHLVFRYKYLKTGLNSDAPEKSRREEKLEELYELEKDNEFWPHDKKYIIVETKPKAKNQIIDKKM